MSRYIGRIGSGSGGGGGAAGATPAEVAQLNAATADVASAQADLDVAEADIVAIEAALSADNATQAELDAAIAARVAAQAVVDAAQDALDVAYAARLDALELIDHPDDDVETVTGTAVDVADPRNPVIDILADMGGADGTNPGDAGAVPAQAATDNTKFLRGDGTWQTVAGSGVRIDASASAVTETLSASADAATIRQFVNIDVTNTATLAVQAGETLNRVTDGTFLFSSYAAGTQFRADEVTGGWVVSVVGVGTDYAPPVSIEGAIAEYGVSDADEDFEALDLNSLVAETVVAGWDVDPANNILNDGFSISADGGLTVPISGWYDVKLRITHPTVRPTAAASGVQDDVGFFRARIYNSTTFGDADGATGGFWDGEFESPDADTIEASSLNVRIYIVGSTNLYVGIRAAIDTAGVESFCIKEFSVKPVEDQVVLAGMVTPTALANFHLRKYEATVNTGFQSFNTYTTSAELDTLGGATERVDLSGSQKILDSSSDFTVNQFSVTANRDIDNAKISSILGIVWEDSEQFEIIAQLVINDVVEDFKGISDGNTNTDQIISLSYSGSLSQNDIVDVRFIKQSGDNDLDQVTIQSIILDIEERPTSTVVMPDAVNVDNAGVADGDTLVWNAANGQYEPQAPSGGSPVAGTVTQAANYIPTASFANTGLTLNLPEAGTYYLAFDVRALIIPEANADRQIQCRLFDTTNGAEVTDTNRIIVFGNVAGVRSELTSSLSTTVTVAGATDIDLQALVNVASASSKFVASGPAGLTSGSFFKVS